MAGREPLQDQVNSAPASATTEQELCLACGLCCNGAIFADVQLQPKDDAARLRALGVRLRIKSGTVPRLLQPCAAHDGCRCQIYPERPRYCREFECRLLKAVNAGRVTVHRARAIIRAARRRVGKVEALLRQLGDTDEHTALGDRFRGVSAKLQAPGIERNHARLYARLTVQFHKLNQLLAERFYSPHPDFERHC